MTTPAARLQAEPDYGAKPPIDLRWEVLAPPTDEMWEAMREAAGSLGMASQWQDPTVLELNETVAALTGHERAMFLPTTTVCIALAWQALDVAGTQAIVEERCHHYWVEHMHMSANAGATPILVRGDKFGAIALDDIRAAMERSYYAARVETGLVSIENTHNVCGGTCLTPEYTAAVADLAHAHGAALFVDGARIWNSAVAQDVPVRDLTGPADAVAISLAKALAAPMGAMLCGSDELLAKVEVLARRTGTLAVHKAGMFAAAALVALRTMLPRVGEDHRRARRLGELLARVEGVCVDLETVQTNFVRVDTTPSGLDGYEFAHRLWEHGVAVHVIDPYAFKLVPSYVTTDEMVEAAAEAVAAVAARAA